MTLSRLRDLIRGEAGIPGNKAMDGWLDSLIQEHARHITSLIRYPELYVPDYTVVATAAQSSIPLPSDLQHLDLRRIRYAVQGDVTRESVLIYRPNFSAFNTGTPRYFQRVGTTIKFYPNANILAGDSFLINYYKYPVLLDPVVDTTVLLPEHILAELKLKVIARVSIQTQPKVFPVYKGLATEAHSESMGQTDLGSMNG